MMRRALIVSALLLGCGEATDGGQVSVDAAVDGFLIDGVVPPDGTECS